MIVNVGGNSVYFFCNVLRVQYSGWFYILTSLTKLTFGSKYCVFDVSKLKSLLERG